MIYTLTLNPSMDYLLFLNEFSLTHTNRSQHEEKFAGGKGINVSRILTRLNKIHPCESIALGFVGGAVGDWIVTQLESEQVAHDFIQIAGETRTNVKIKIKQGETKEVEVNANGPSITESEQSALKAQLQRLSSNDLVILSGNVPSSLPADFYQQLIEMIVQQKAQFVLDTNGQALKDSLKYRPLLIKPNQEELSTIMQKELTTQEDIIEAGKTLQQLGAQNVLISLGAGGACLITQNAIYSAKAPKGQLKNSVGAGDSMVAGFVAEYQKTQNLEQALRFSIASGSATAFSDDLATADEILKLIPQVDLNLI